MRLTSIDCFLQVAFPGLTGFNEENGWETEIGGQRTKLGCFSTDFPLPGHKWHWLFFLVGVGIGVR